MDISEIKTNLKLSPRQKKPLPESISEQRSFIYFYFLFQQKTFIARFPMAFVSTRFKPPLTTPPATGTTFTRLITPFARTLSETESPASDWFSSEPSPAVSLTTAKKLGLPSLPQPVSTDFQLPLSTKLQTPWISQHHPATNNRPWLQWLQSCESARTWKSQYQR